MKLLALVLFTTSLLAQQSSSVRRKVECGMCGCGNPNYQTCSWYCEPRKDNQGKPRGLNEKEQGICEKTKVCIEHSMCHPGNE